MKQFYSIVFKSTKATQAPMLGQFLAVADDGSDAQVIQKGVENMVAQIGDKGWIPHLVGKIPAQIDESKKEVLPEVSNVEEKKISLDEEIAKKQDEIADFKMTRNWVLNIIIDKQDNNLFTALGPYLTEPEKLFINDKLSV